MTNDPFDLVIQLDPDTKEFTSKDQREFFVHSDLDTLPMGRFEEWERKSIELGFARSWSSIFDSLTNAQNFIVEGKKVPAIIELDNLRRGMSRMTTDRHSIAFYLCTLFIFEKGEDPFTWTLEKANSKIDCWSKEYGSSFFLALAIGSVAGYKERFLSTTKEFSEMSQMSQLLETAPQDEPDGFDMVPNEPIK